jgi:uncharacterized iron-regulated protein
MEHRSAKEFDRNPILDQHVKTDNDLKNILVQYVGEKNSPKDNNVTVEMIVESLAEEFPEFVLAVAEENWIRGYQQALDDVETGRGISEAETSNEKKKSCKLCEK